MVAQNVSVDTGHEMISLRDYVATVADNITRRMEDKMVERDLRWSQRFEAQENALQHAMTSMDKLLAERDARFTERFAAMVHSEHASMEYSQRAIEKSEASTDKRFESVNEFRAQLNDMVTQLMPRAESTGRYQALSEKVDNLQTRIDKNDGSGAGLKQGWTVLVGVVAAVGVLISLFVALKPAESAPAVATLSAANAATVANNNARITDLVSRLDSLSARINTLSSGPAK